MARLLLLLVVLAVGCAPRPIQPPAAPVTLLLVRHAERADDSRDTPLSEAGQCRARALRAALGDAGVDAIFVSQYRRTHETARPLADALGLDPVEHRLEGDSLEAARALARALLADPPGPTVLVVGHSNTVPAMLGVLTGHEPPELDGYGDLYVVTAAPAGPPGALHLRFGDGACGERLP